MSCEWGTVTVRDILGPVRGRLISGDPETRLTGISTDSRQILPGNIFLALRGEHFDGHSFIPMAMSDNAAGAIAEEGYVAAFNEISLLKDKVFVAVKDTCKALGDLAGWWRRQHSARVIAVTGSAGKTTTKELIASILSSERRVLKNRGNFNNLIGLPITLLNMDNTHEIAVVEMGMNRPDEIYRLTEIADPDIGVITNVGMAHLEGVGDFSGVVRAKAELAQKMSDNGILIINGDSPDLVDVVSSYRRDPVTFGFGEHNHVRGKEVMCLGNQGTRFKICYRGKCWQAKMPFPGFHMVSNALAAFAACMYAGISVENILSAIGSFTGVKGRFQVIPLPGNITLIDDTYNASPSSLKSALESIKKMAKGSARIIVALGDMLELGDASPMLHRQAGRDVADIDADYLVTLGSLSSELIKGAVGAGMPVSHIRHVDSHRDMSDAIKKRMTSGCMILVKGSRRMGLENVIVDLAGNEPA